MPNTAIIGGGPAGLRAAEIAAQAGHQVTLYDSMRSVGRKFLVAGKSGLNITNAQPFPDFTKNYHPHDLSPHFHQILNNFNNHNLRQWAADLGINTYAASSGKVFPVGMKAAPLLRRLIEKLRRLDVTFKVRHTLTNIQPGPPHQLTFLHDQQKITATHTHIILALGGASWPKTGSTGKWTQLLQNLGARITPLTAANCGWETNWSPALLTEAEGLPLKNITASAGNHTQHGELIITRYGLEGAPIYKLGPAIKTLQTPSITIDLKPSFTTEKLIAKMESAKRNLLHEATLRWKLPPAATAIIKHLHGEPTGVPSLANIAKNLTIPLTHPRPITEAISTAGGVQFDSLTKDLALKNHPTIHCIGEMLDYDAPTGGYLLQAAFATASHLATAPSFNLDYRNDDHITSP